MITEIVTFRLKPGMTRQEMLEDARTTVDRWSGYPGLVRKTYAMADDQTGMGIYLWESRQHAEAGHDEAWLTKAEARWGVRPEITYHDTVMVLDNRAGEVLEFSEE